VAQQRRIAAGGSAAGGLGVAATATVAAGAATADAECRKDTSANGNDECTAVCPATGAGVAGDDKGSMLHNGPAASMTTCGGAAGAVGVKRTYADASAGVLGCRHYRRAARLVAPCCGKVFTCRLCHDDVSDHRLDRYAVREMECMHCGERQPVGSSCRHCSASLASYYCGICHLFDDEPGRSIYHCPFCNVCRRGKGLGVDFFHCMQCNSCMSLSLFDAHTCRERAMEANCPVCREYLFDSAAPIKELPCGHFLHSSCFAEYARYAYTCPICCKSIGNMGTYFQMLDSLLASERGALPPGYAGRTQDVMCHDCGRAGSAPFHFVYHACPHCRSYNTRLL
jgi:zinc finger protein-like protein